MTALAACLPAHHECSTCGRIYEMRWLAPYYAAGDDRSRFACEDDECREAARAEMRGERADRRAL